jgi:hypothetical protein
VAAAAVVPVEEDKEMVLMIGADQAAVAVAAELVQLVEQVEQVEADRSQYF